MTTNLKLVPDNQAPTQARTAASNSQETANLVATAKRVLPGGNFGNVASDIIIREGKGGRVWDENGNEYVDFLLGSGPMLIGHAHPEVTAVVQAQIPRGTTFFANNRHGIQLAAEIVDAVPCAEQVRFVSTGTEADLYAMRLARAFTKRDKILKFEGGYHGMSDYALMSLTPKRTAPYPEAIPDSPGIPKSVRHEVLIAPFNDIDVAVALIKKHKDELGGVIVEPLQRILAPAPGFLQALRKVTAECGIPLIFDEVVTGFRFAYGGAQAYYGVTPDLCTLGKICGGGYPVAAVTGRADIMAHFDRARVGDEGFMTQVGTLSGNPIGSVAGLATLAVLKRPGTYERIFAMGRELMAELTEQIKRSGLPAQVVGEPALFDVVFATGDIRNYRDVQRADTVMAKRFNALLRENGIFKGETKYYVSLAHTAEDMQRTRDAWTAAFAQLVREQKTAKTGA
jgi:glutamate-1-semialdehyde 2,1-aminomutase